MQTLDPQEQREISRRVVPLLVGASLLVVGWLHSRLMPGQTPISAALQAAAALVVVVPIFVRGARGFLASPPQDLSAQLVALATLAALSVGDFITATLVPLFMEVGRLFEERSSRGARQAIEAIQRLYARRARVMRSGEECELSPDAVQLGETVVVRPGETIPVDGTILQGRSMVDQSPITGESTPESLSAQDSVYAGSVSMDGLLEIEATGVGEDSLLGRIVENLREVENSKSPIQRWIDRTSGWYLPVILAIAAVTLFVSGELSRAIAVLVVACPSALFLAGPVAIVSALTACSRIGILIKGPGFLESVPEIKSLILDKTGTVTEGRLALSHFEPAPLCDADEVLQLAACCGFASNHPVSKAVVAEARSRGLSVVAPTESAEIPGLGVEAWIDGTLYRLGRREWIQDDRSVVPFPAAASRRSGLAQIASESFHPPQPTPSRAEATGMIAVIARGDELLGEFQLTDRTRAEAREALDELRELGVERCVLVTGDRASVAQSIAEPLGLDAVAADLLPEDKLAYVREEQRKYGRVMMVGDGVNDALAMSGADVGVAVGARAHEVALSGADIALVRGDLTRLPRMIEMAAFTRRIVVENVAIVAAVGVVMVLLASIGWITPLTGAWLHNIDALFVILNSARLVRATRPLIESES